MYNELSDTGRLLRPSKNCDTHHSAMGQPAREDDGEYRELDNYESDLKEGVNRVQHAVVMEAAKDGICVLVPDQV